MNGYDVILSDVSQYQDDYDTEKKPDVKKLAAAGILGLFVRVGFGRVMDRMFKWFWSTAKGILERIPYWYLDYYSHKTLKTPVSDEEWGKEQANNLYAWTKDDPGEAPAVVDCEQSGFGGRITILNKGTFNRILKAFFDQYRLLTGKKLIIYCSPGFIPLFDDWVKDLTLWVAWYSRTKTKAQVIEYCRSKGWRGPILFWQFTSDGDLDGDGIADGLKLGMETSTLDFNVWFGTMQEWSKFSGSTPAPVTPPEEDEPDIPEPVQPGIEKSITIQRITYASGANIRNKPTTVGSAVTMWLPKGAVVEVLETVIVSTSEIWVRVGQQQWIAKKYNGILRVE